MRISPSGVLLSVVLLQGCASPRVFQGSAEDGTPAQVIETELVSSGPNELSDKQARQVAHIRELCHGKYEVLDSRTQTLVATPTRFFLQTKFRCLGASA